MTDCRLVLTGDSLLTRPLSTIESPDLAALERLVKSADFAFTNLEFVCPIPPMVPRARWDGLHVYAPALVLDELKAFGFNLFSLAHNHTLDYSGGGLAQTLRALDERSMVTAGAGSTLSQARRPRYLDRNGLRASIMAATSTEGQQTIAADPDGIVEGRPGVSALRFSTEYEVVTDQLDALVEIDEALGTAEGTRMKSALSLVLGSGPPSTGGRTLQFLGANFVEGASAGVRTHPSRLDVEDITRWIREARRQSDLVVVSVHCHEGAHGTHNSDTIADFAREAARRFIDAGADVFVGHGPHQLAGMEMYRGKPIFHSLGNLAFMVESVETVPEEFLLAAGLPPRSTHADFQDQREGPVRGTRGFSGLTAFWESVVPVCEFTDGRLAKIELWPLVLDKGSRRALRGVPGLASGAAATAVLERFARLAQPFGTVIELGVGDNRPVGRVVL